MSALRWADVDDAANSDGGALVTVRRGKTNQECETRDVRFVKGGVARAITRTSEPTERKPNERTSADREGIITTEEIAWYADDVGQSILRQAGLTVPDEDRPVYIGKDPRQKRFSSTRP